MPSDPFTITIEGIPAPGGSKNAYHNKHTGRIAVVDAGKGNTAWKQLVAVEARRQRGGRPVLMGAVECHMTFWLPRPKSHFRKDGTLKPTAPQRHKQAPDALKLARSTEDALKGVVWHDDCLVQLGSQCKAWCIAGSPPGCSITVTPLEE